MKGLEKLTSIRLAEVLTQKGVVPAEAITNALYIQDRYGEAFVDIMVESGHIAEWDLVRVVVENFQLPFFLSSNYEFDDTVRERIPADDLFPNLLVPLGVFGNIVTISMPVLTTAEVLLSLEKKHEIEIFPYVGLISENKMVLQAEFKEFKDWHKDFVKKKEQRAAKRNEKGESSSRSQVGDGWTNLFDNANDAVLDSIDKRHTD